MIKSQFVEKIKSLKLCKVKAFYYPGLILSLLVLSHLSNYQIPHLAQIPFENIIFLTPYAIIKNFMAGNTHLYFMDVPVRFTYIWKYFLFYIPVFVFSFLIIKSQRGEK